jgi:lysozyme
VQLRQVDAVGLAFIKQWEHLALVGYADIGGVATAGWGHTGPDVIIGQTYTEEQCAQWLIQDIQWAQEAVMNSILPDLGQNQFNACVSLCYNIGAAGFASSSVALDCNRHNFSAAADAFLLWDKVDGTVVRGLLNRRTDERALFLTPDAVSD